MCAPKNFVPGLLLAFLLCWRSDTVMSAGGPKSLPKLQREALQTIVHSTGMFLSGITGASAASSPKSPSSCTCKDPADKRTCTCGAGFLGLREQMDQYSQGEFYNPKNERIYDTSIKSFVPAHPEDHLPKALGDRSIIVFGEVHSNRCHHHAEFEVVRAMSHIRPPEEMAIGLECFYRQHQGALDDFVFGHRDMGQLKRDTNWKNTWGYDLNYYAKIFKFAAQNKVRLVGLNVPYQVVQLISANGFDQLEPSLRRLLPKMDLANLKHRQQFVEAIQSSSAGSHELAEKSMQKLYEAQTLWDEYMSETAARHVAKHPEQMLLVIAGVGHVLGRVGIPDRIKRRTGKDPFVIVPQQVSWSARTGLPDIAQPLTRQDADWAWYTEVF